jgi:plasmid stabilization system protein ParE
LATFPDSGKVVPEFETPWLRELELPLFRIVYRRDESVVTVVRVWRSERLMDPNLGGSGA